MLETNQDKLSMKTFLSGRQAILALVAVLFLATSQNRLKAVDYISNLGNLWNGGDTTTIGDIHALFPGGHPYGNDTNFFSTGAGNFTLNAITLEFYATPGSSIAPPGNWLYLNVQIFQHFTDGFLLAGVFGQIRDNPSPTQWPQNGSNPYTQLVDFIPSGTAGRGLALQPFIEYSIVLKVTSGTRGGSSLLFTTSANYVTPTDWTMGPTTTGNPNANGEYLKFAVDATPVPEPGLLQILAATIGLMAGCRQITGKKSVRSSPPNIPLQRTQQFGD